MVEGRDASGRGRGLFEEELFENSWKKQKKKKKKKNEER